MDVEGLEWNIYLGNFIITTFFVTILRSHTLAMCIQVIIGMQVSS